MTMTCDDVRDLAAGFVLGALTASEAAAVRGHLATCAEPHPELAELGGVVPYLAESLEPIEPPAALKARILAAAAAERGQAGSVVQLAAVARPRPRPRPWRAWAMQIAAVLAIAALGAWNLQLQARLSGVEDDLAAARAYQEGVANVLALATQPGSQTAFLVATDPAMPASGVAAAGSDGTVVVAMHDLKPTAGSEVYEAWVIVGDAAPVPLGGFQVGLGGTGLFQGSTPLAEPGAILALTLEPGPGATTPTLPVLTVGSLVASG